MEVVKKREKSLKRKLEPSILDTFTKLTSPQAKIRIKTGVNLLKQVAESEKGDSDLNYALNRLIRGVGSSNVDTRCGFYSSLVGLLNFRDVHIGQVLGVVDKELHKGGNNSKSENADISLGKILVGGAILRSNLYDKCEKGEKIRIFQLILEAGKERQYLPLASYSFLCDFFGKVSNEDFQLLILPLIEPEICKKWPEQTLDSLYLLLVVQEKFSQFFSEKLLKDSLGTPKIICEDSLGDLCQVLTAIPRITSLSHSVYDIFVGNLLKTEFVVEFFIELDKILLKSNRNKFLVITKILISTIENLENLKQLPLLLTENYIKQMINLFKTNNKIKDRQFQQSCHKLFQVILKKLKETKNKTKIKIVKKFLFNPGTLIFEKITKSKIVQNITILLSANGVKNLAEIYRSVIVSADCDTEKYLNLDRLYTARLLVKLLHFPVMQQETDWKIEQVKFLMHLGLLKNPEISPELAENFAETFFSALNLKLTKLSDLRTILNEIVRDLNDNLENCRLNFDAATMEIWRKSLKFARKCGKTSSDLAMVFGVLFMHLSVQVFNETNNKLAIDSLGELFECYERVRKGGKDDGKKEEELLWIEVVTDLFLNLLSHNSQLLRNIVNMVFPYLCEFLNLNCVRQILSVFDGKEDGDVLTRNGEEEDGDSGSVGEESEESSEEEDDDEMDVENEYEDETTNEKLKMALHQVLTENHDSDQESIDLNDLNDEDGEKLNNALAEAFKQFKPPMRNEGKSKKKQNRDDEILTHFRIRVLDLIEIYLNAPKPSLAALLEIMCKLLETYEFAVKDPHQKPLQGRLGVCLKKLCSLRRFAKNSEQIGEPELCALLNSLMGDRKSAILVQEMSNQISDCCIFLVAINADGEYRSIAGIFRENLRVFFEKRDCLIPFGLFRNLCQLNWMGVTELVPELYGFVFDDDIRPFRRNQALELLKVFYGNHRLLKSVPEEIRNLLKDKQEVFLGRVVEFLGDAAKVGGVKEKFLGGLFGVVGSMKMSVVGVGCDWEEVGSVVGGLRGKRTLGTDAKGAFNKLCKCLNV